MIGRWVDTLAPLREHRLLTTPLIPFRDVWANGGCLVAVVLGAVERAQRFEPLYPNDEWMEAKALGDWRGENLAERFNALCLRLGGVKGVARRRLGRRHDIFADGPPDYRQFVGAFKAADLIRKRIERNRQRRALEQELAALEPALVA